MTALAWDVYESPLGPLILRAGPQGLRAIGWPEAREGLDASHRDPGFGALPVARAQLEEYFAGRRRAFDLPLDLRGTPFQRRVWDELSRIPYGATTSYGQVAERVGRPERARAIGGAVGRTPVPIVVPCHRVVGADGGLTGYGGGLPRKRALLALERDHGAPIAQGTQGIRGA